MWLSSLCWRTSSVTKVRMEAASPSSPSSTEAHKKQYSSTVAQDSMTLSEYSGPSSLMLSASMAVVFEAGWGTLALGTSVYTPLRLQCTRR